MSDLADDFRFLTELRKERHARWHDQNMKVLRGAGLPFVETNDGETLLFRVPGYQNADFYPSTGRWRSHGKTFRGGATAFIGWLKANRVPTENRGGER